MTLTVKKGNRMGHIILLAMGMQRHFIKKLDLPVLVSAERGQFYPQTCKKVFIYLARSLIGYSP